MGLSIILGSEREILRRGIRLNGTYMEEIIIGGDFLTRGLAERMSGGEV